MTSSMIKKRRVRVVTSGGASHVATLAGALYALDKRVEIAGVGGTSAGALASIGYAFGIPQETVFRLIADLLKDNRVRDKSVRTMAGRAGTDGQGDDRDDGQAADDRQDETQPPMEDHCEHPASVATRTGAAPNPW